MQHRIHPHAPCPPAMHNRSPGKMIALDNVSPATRLLEKRQQMFEVQEALEMHKLEFNRKVCKRHTTAPGRLAEPHPDSFIYDPAIPLTLVLQLCQ
jgi:hypothetical protein